MAPMPQPQQHATRALARFARDERGALLVLFALSLVVILGFAAVILDLGRTATTQTELQSYADGIALAAAAELDGEPDSIDRANAAAREPLLAGRQTFGAGRKTLDANDITLRFYDDLPADDRDPLNDAISDPAQARFVQAEIAPRDIPLSFTRAFDALRGREPRATPRVAADAVAGFTRQVCEVAQTFFCLPDPGWDAEDNIGQMVQMRGGGGGGHWGPGNFGFLDPSPGNAVAGGPCDNLNGGNLRDCLFAAENPTTGCYTVRGVDTLPGQRMGNAPSALNVRFDEFEKGMRNEAGNPAYRPAPNVVRGIVEPTGGNTCRPGNAEANTVSPPLDTCLQDGSCTPARFGDGVSAGSLNAYLARNHGDENGNYAFDMGGVTVIRDWGDDDDLGDVSEETPPPALIDLVNDPERAPRYEIYRAEIENAAGDDILDMGTGPGQKRESGRPVCAPSWSSDPDRRVLLAAGIDCAAHELRGRSTDIPVQEYVRLFLTAPAGTRGNDAALWAEVIGSGERDGAGHSVAIIRDLVRLVR